jgi:inosine/xanthosine triphosphate pyrophosphatase family protein
MSLIKVDAAKSAATQNAKRIAELRKMLADTDYVALSDYDQDKPEIKAQRQTWRNEIRQLQGAE